MTITYCRDDSVSSRWSGVDRLLTEFEVDYNFYQHETRIGVLEASVTVTVSVSSITQTGSDLTFHMSDATTQGPFTLPSATFVDRGAWAAATPYLANDTFTANGALYRVLVDHTSGASFSPTANDGAGHDYYAAMMSSPGNALPTGGATGQVLQKSSGTDYAVTWGYKLPTGGTTNQVLLKLSATTQDAAWTTLAASMVSFTPSTASSLTSSDVASALEELETLVGASGGASALSDLTDVAFATDDPHHGAVLYYDLDLGKWRPTAFADTGDILIMDSGVLTPTQPSFSMLTDSPSITQLRNTTITDIPSGAVIHPELGNIFTVTPAADKNFAAYTVPDCAEITLIVITSGTTSYNITFNSDFISQGTLATGTVTGKHFTVKFVAVSGKFIEVSRTAAM
jgi:hypothetical protein